MTSNTFPIFNRGEHRTAINPSQVGYCNRYILNVVKVVVRIGDGDWWFEGDDADTVWSYFTGEPHPKVTEWAEDYVETGGYEDGLERRLEIEREARNAYQLVNVLSRAADICERRKASDVAALEGDK